MSGLPSQGEGNESLSINHWNYLTAQVDLAQGIQEVFLNGESVSRQSFNTTTQPLPLDGVSWVFGASTVPFSIDEIRLTDSVLSIDWVRASYENQAGNFNFPILGSVSGENAFTSAAEYTIEAEVYFEETASATGNPVAYLATGLPGGITIDPTDGKLSGIPLRAGSFEAQIQAIYLDYSTAFQQITLNIIPGPPQVLLSNVISNDTSSLTIEFEVNATGGDDPNVFIVADLEDHGTDLYAWKYRNNIGKHGFGNHNAVLSGLDADQRYYVRIFAENIAGN